MAKLIGAPVAGVPYLDPLADAFLEATAVRHRSAPAPASGTKPVPAPEGAAVNLTRRRRKNGQKN